ncbi:MAG: hormogonium polysaccharide biosynthesis glycosyltransferase HpsE [Mastigocoleus sp. MO_167.B18]|uniref:hormogonium polysaccharide biosynthesis glycosyltransferase HpsE n=1 Tax=Mastigocoleus sp. MO_188.B34 TaxID=3036635 RepID=UPI00261AFCBF|nr:hormogonium polysaccharide biosynthesis glycosyltransferase HpsE [Mastigocoleus sp. MO_188.B34]MDJ0696177.1 hormogonium polysaccharide biosynthesis glycosyltransferase HpsE [Mastigocoleus sp. MO_188.B34]MDJ0772188.1 hormogonium polysaccharide biosynthesis glycosyltransferase HpsE [Mastigocoleus sp. MO_167.B18]
MKNKNHLTKDINKKIDFTVAVPTYNGETSLPGLLEKLKQQINTEDINWEIIIIDNNSNDNTAIIIQDYQNKWKHTFPLKYFLEPKQGAAYARQRAIDEAKSELIGFLDDDNYPVSNWVEEAYKFAIKYPQAGAFTSQIHPKWEIEPPENFQPLAPFLAITERGNLPLLYKPQTKLLPPSAGFVVRRQAWLEGVPKKSILIGRITGNMLAGEDLEIFSYIQKLGWEIWYNPEMETYHQIPQWRLQKEYLLPFFRGIGLSRYVTRTINIQPWVKPLAFVAYMLNDLKKILLHLCKYRFKVKTELVAACEMQLFVGSFFSPFYLWKHGYFKSQF